MIEAFDVYENRNFHGSRMIEVRDELFQYKALFIVVFIFSLFFIIPGIVFWNPEAPYVSIIGTSGIVMDIACGLLLAKHALWVIRLYPDHVQEKRWFQTKKYAYHTLQVYEQEVIKSNGNDVLRHRFIFSDGFIQFTDKMTNCKDALEFFETIECPKIVQLDCGFDKNARACERYKSYPNYVMGVYFGPEQKDYLGVINCTIFIAFIYTVFIFSYPVAVLKNIMVCAGIFLLLFVFIQIYYLEVFTKKCFLFSDRFVLTDRHGNEKKYRYQDIRKTRIHVRHGRGTKWVEYHIMMKNGEKVKLHARMIHAKQAYEYLTCQCEKNK